MIDTEEIVLREFRARVAKLSPEARIRMACGMLTAARMIRESARGGGATDPRTSTSRVRRFRDTYGREFDDVTAASIIEHLEKCAP